MNNMPTKIGGLLLTIFLTASCSSKVKLSQEEYDSLVQTNRSLTNEVAGHHRLAQLLQDEYQDPEVKAIKIGAVLAMFAKREPAFKESLLQVLSEYDISLQDLEERVKFEKTMMGLHEKECTGDSGVFFNGINFCRTLGENTGAPKKYNPLKDGMHLGEVPTAE